MPEQKKIGLKFTKANTSFRPFEVIQMEEDKVAINTGLLMGIISGNIIKDADFTSAAKPQDLEKRVNDALFLTVEEKDTVCILIKNVSSKPETKIAALDNDKLNDREEYKPSEWTIVKLAFIESIEEVGEDGAKVKHMNIKYLYQDKLAYDTLLLPAFTPLMWSTKLIEDESGEIDSGGEADPEDVVKCVFVPGGVHLPHASEEVTICEINGESMFEFPIQDVTAGDIWYIEFNINKAGWTLNGTPKFTKDKGDEIQYTITQEVCFDEDLQGECESRDGVYRVKVLEFLTDAGGGIKPKIYWRSDYTIHHQPRCQHCDSSSSSGSSGATGSLRLIDCDVIEKVFISWIDGLIQENGPQEAQLGECINSSVTSSGTP